MVPKLRAAGWDKRQIREPYLITNGKIVASARRHRSGNPLVADYVQRRILLTLATGTGSVGRSRAQRLRPDWLPEAPDQGGQRARRFCSWLMMTAIRRREFSVHAGGT